MTGANRGFCGVSGVPNPSVSGTLTFWLSGAELGSKPSVRIVYDCCKNEADVGDFPTAGGASRLMFAVRYRCNVRMYDSPDNSEASSSCRVNPSRSIVRWVEREGGREERGVEHSRVPFSLWRSGPFPVMACPPWESNNLLPLSETGVFFC